MHARLAEAMTYVEDKRAELLKKLEGVDRERMAQRPAEDKWSVAEILDHLTMVEGGIARLVAKRCAQARATGLRSEDSTESILGCINHMVDTLDNARIEVPDQVRPRTNPDPAKALQGLQEGRQSLREAAKLADGLALGEIKHTHVLLGELDLYQWIVFLGRHEARHTRQVERTLNSLPAPSAR